MSRRFESALLFWFALGAGLVLAGCAGAAEMERNDLAIFGWVERVELVDAGFAPKAKLDTGAATSSLDAADIERFNRDGDEWVRFTLTDPDSDQHMTLEKPVSRNVRIVRHDGDYQRRAVVEMDICMGDRLRSVEVSLVDRSEFIYPLLIGRSALEGHALVDSGQTFEFYPDCRHDESVED